MERSDQRIPRYETLEILDTKSFPIDEGTGTRTGRMVLFFILFVFWRISRASTPGMTTSSAVLIAFSCV